MEKQFFKIIENERLLGANNSAKKLIEKLNELNLTEKDIKDIYFKFIEIHASIFDKNQNNGNLIFENIHRIFAENILLKNNDIISCLFLNELINHDSNGNKISHNEFLKQIRTKFGENSELTFFFKQNIKKLYPNFKDIKKESFCYIFALNIYKSYEINFNARITEKQQYLLLDFFENSFSKNILTELKMFFEIYHIEYDSLNVELFSIDSKKTKNKFINLFFNVDDYIKEKKKFFNNYYIIISYSFWEDDFYDSKTCILKAKENECGILCYKNIEQINIIDEEGECFGTINFKERDSLYKLKNMSEISYLNKFSYSVSFEILKNIDNINDINDIKKIEGIKEG